ncbi:MAG: D-alanine--D-alanine ligase [Oscillospiraceae bacterium]|nr:D-alanine--D-alanine ligase [Oscillospiraceae bacterium]
MSINIAVFFGGRSVEHEVSVISACQAMAAMKKYNPIPIYITKDGGMYTGEGFDRIESYKDIPKLLKSGHSAAFVRAGGEVLLTRHPAKMFGGAPVPVHAALPVTHGTYGEDGTIAGLCESLGLPYAGCDIFASAVCMDKAASKALLNAAGLPVLPCAVYSSSSYHSDKNSVLLDIESKFEYPVIVKPVGLGSSVGITKAGDKDGLSEALELAFAFDSRVLVEKCLTDMKEINCAVLGDADGARASVCESPYGGEILSYEDKYLSGSKGSAKGMGSGGREIPADIPLETAKAVQELAVRAFQELGCAGVVRIDFMLAGGEIYINELNTIPGSLSFYLWEAAGLGFGELIDELIKLALARKRRREQLTTTIDTNILSGFSSPKLGKESS